MTITLGFLGTGNITAHMVHGLKTSELADWTVVLSPRNANIARDLAKLPEVEVAAMNQDVPDRAGVVVLAVRPQAAEAVLEPLTFAPDTPLISLIATLKIATLQKWTGAKTICRAIPLPFVSRRRDVTRVFPPHPQAMQIFGALGQALAVQDIAQFDVYGSALMATYFGLVETANSWMVRHGAPDADADLYLRALFADLGQSLRNSPATLPDLRLGHSTAGGVNEQSHRVFAAQGGSPARKAGLAAIHARVLGSAA